MNLKESDALVGIGFFQMPTTRLKTGLYAWTAEALARPDGAKLCQLAHTKSHNTVSVCTWSETGLAPATGRLAGDVIGRPDG